MKFVDGLKLIVDDVPGSLGASINGLDGLIIAEYKKIPDSELDFTMLGAEMTTLLKRAVKTSDDIHMGPLQEISIMDKNKTLIMKTINEEYYLLLALESSGSMGKGRYALKKAVYMFEKEF
jgi:predicted regulator of Ras-like GTPase activity (Roadblock/LC7/MglB family)